MYNRKLTDVLSPLPKSEKESIISSPIDTNNYQGKRPICTQTIVEEPPNFGLAMPVNAIIKRGIQSSHNHEPIMSGIPPYHWEGSEKACVGLYSMLKWGYQSGHWYRHQVQQHQGGNVVRLATAVHP
jgi:hypothetical protein